MDSVAYSQVDVSAYRLEPDALRHIPRSLALRHDVLSLASDGNQITIALPDVNDRDTIDRVRLATGMHVRAVVAPREHIRARLFDAYCETGAKTGSDSTQIAAEAPAVQTLELIHSTALNARASDIHIEPSRGGGMVRHRVDGILTEMLQLAPDLYAQVISRVKILAGMDIADKRQPQDGRYSIVQHGQEVDARVSSMPTVAGEKLVVRLLDHAAAIPALLDLGIPSRYIGPFRKVLRAPYGFVIVAGPTGSGKTTTLYAGLCERDMERENICSVEDPVEATIPGAAQVQVNPKAGVTFASAVRAFLRQDPNVIMVGEMRDAETAAVASGAALSGQLVLTTLHCNDAPTALERLGELGVPRYTLASGLTAVVAQRLVRKLCRACKVPSLVERETASEFKIDVGAPSYRAVGCERCDGSGYAGRTAVFEFLFADQDVRACIAQGHSGTDVAQIARTRGYEPMAFEGIRLALAGVTTFDEVRRVLIAANASC